MILSIESSCDDSSVAITRIDTLELIFHKKVSQELEHSFYGGVVPELAARLHIKALPIILEECEQYFAELRAIAVTTSPGLSVTLSEGVMMAKALSISLNIPLIAVNHLRGHIYSCFIEKRATFPMTILLVSGGHTQIIEANNLSDMKVIGQTTDDSFGESFDKVAKMLHLGYPGGPIVESKALCGKTDFYNFPIPLKQSPNIEFSFSGLKNAVRLAILKEEKNGNLNESKIANVCASFQYTAISHVIMKLKKYFKTRQPQKFAIVGGASANAYLRQECEKLCKSYGCELVLAPIEYCSDNAAMIGRVAVEQYLQDDFVIFKDIDIKTKAGAE